MDPHTVPSWTEMVSTTLSALLGPTSGHSKRSEVRKILIPLPDSWTRQRKWVHAAMADSYRHHFHGHIEAETKRWLAMLLLDPAGFLPHTREHCGRIMTRLAWDDATLGADNGVRADRTLTWMSVSGPITNTMTPLWHLPFAVNPWKKYEVEREREQRASWVSNFRIAKKRFMAGELPSDTWTYRYFDQLQREGNATLEQAEDQELFSSCMIGFFSLVGVVTISGPLKFFIMAMTVHLEWQRKVQEEVDRVCGDRMPTIADYAAMPITRACLKETLRWRSGVPLGELITDQLFSFAKDTDPRLQVCLTGQNEMTSTGESSSRRTPSSSPVNGKPSWVPMLTISHNAHNFFQGHQPRRIQVPGPGPLSPRALAGARVADLPGTSLKIPQLPRGLRHAHLRLGPARLPGQGHRAGRDVRFGGGRLLGVRYVPQKVPGHGKGGAYRHIRDQCPCHPRASAVGDDVQAQRREAGGTGAGRV